MSSLTEKLRKEQASLEKKAEERGESKFVKTNFFKPEKGKNIIRILPNWKDKKELFFYPVKVHFNVPTIFKDGNEYKVVARCREDWGKECPLCERHKELSALGGSEARNYKPVERYLYNLLHYKAKKVTVYPAPVTVHQEIIKWSNDAGGEIIVDYKKGRNFELIKEVDPSKPIQFGTSYKVYIDLKETEIPSKLLQIIEESGLSDLEAVYGVDYYKDMCKMVGTKPDDEEVIDPDPEVKKAKPKAKAKTVKEPEVPEITEESEELADIDVDDDEDLEAELRAMGIDA